jgi:hypothetical protein
VFFGFNLAVRLLAPELFADFGCRDGPALRDDALVAPK